MPSSLRVAIVHEKFTIDAGSERVVQQLHLLWPNAPVYCAVADRTTMSGALADADIRPDPLLQRLYRGGDNYAHLLPLLPFAAARRHLNDYDVVVTSHHQFANRVRSNAPVVSYTHTPARWLWDPSMRSDEIGGQLGRAMLGAFAATQRRADRRSAQRLHHIVANSSEVASRIERWWGRASTIIAPPVNTEFFSLDTAIDREDFYLLAGRLVPYKHPEIAIAAAVRAGVELIVAGDGRAMPACRTAAGTARNVRFVGATDNATLRDYYRKCRAFLYPGREDFGIMPVEAQSCGAPVIALSAGGALDTVAPLTTGVLYPESDDAISTLAEVLRDFEPQQFDAQTIALHAQQFRPEVFRSSMRAVVEEAAATT